ncbi:ADP-ribose pyrophosphatase, mitochondrial-like [Babylonia areolata]|uniref:ADP-ribose pyrophosphatase, mitochondrial-like n=1 Tax=Babylonia areolata TaxID=304850 RepID=UPI003FD4DBE7
MLTLLSTFSYILGGRASASAQYTSTCVMKNHRKARCDLYPRTNDVQRGSVPDEKVPWSEPFPEYSPVDYTAPAVKNGPVWADVDFRENGDEATKEKTGSKWTTVEGFYRMSPTGTSHWMNNRNPVGRTGVVGRGLLGRWGPNHAADPIVTRWKRDANGDKVMKDGCPVLQFIAVQRRDNNEWALPGGMVDAGEVITMTIKREFGEEALNSLEASSEEKKTMEKHINDLFAKGVEIYRGYVDDPRNTDNAWMETIAMNFHDDNGSSVANFRLNAGDDAVGVQWMDLHGSMKLYASHVDFLEETARRLKAFW